jgi:hypothetical protein
MLTLARPQSSDPSLIALEHSACRSSIPLALQTRNSQPPPTQSSTSRRTLTALVPSPHRETTQSNTARNTAKSVPHNHSMQQNTTTHAPPRGLVEDREHQWPLYSSQNPEIKPSNMPIPNKQTKYTRQEIGYPLHKSQTAITKESGAL